MPPLAGSAPDINRVRPSGASAEREPQVARPHLLRIARPGLSAVVFVLVLTVYLLVPVKDYFFDGLEFAQTIEDSRGFNIFLFHPNHLFYTATGYVLYRATHPHSIRQGAKNAAPAPGGVVAPVSLPGQTDASTPRALSLLVWFNAVVSALAAIVFFQILMAISGSAYLSFVTTLAFAFSATWWRYSPNSDAYIPSIFFLLLSFWLILPRRSAHPVMLAVTHSLAMLFHQLAVMFYPVAVVGLLLQGDAPLKIRIRRAFTYSLIAVATVVTTYCLVFRLGTGRFRFDEFRHWVMFHDSTVGFEFNFARNLGYTLHGTAQLLLATKISWLGHDSFSRGLLAMAIVLAAVAFFLMARHGGDLGEVLRSAKTADRKLIALAALWVAMYLGFLFFWVPANQHYRPFYAAPIFLLAGILWAPYESMPHARRRFRAALLVGAFALLNLTLTILPLSRQENIQPLVYAKQMHQSWPTGTVVLYENYVSTLTNWWMRYFNPQTDWRQVAPGAVPISEADLQRTYDSGGTVWFDTTLTDLPQWNSPPLDIWLRDHTRPGSLHSMPQKGWHVHFQQIFPAR